MCVAVALGAPRQVREREVLRSRAEPRHDELARALARQGEVRPVHVEEANGDGAPPPADLAGARLGHAEHDGAAVVSQRDVPHDELTRERGSAELANARVHRGVERPRVNGRARQRARPELAHGAEIDAARLDLGARVARVALLIERRGHTDVAHDARDRRPEVDLEGPRRLASRGRASGGARLDPENANARAAGLEDELTLRDADPFERERGDARYERRLRARRSSPLQERGRSCPRPGPARGGGRASRARRRPP